MSSGRRDDRPNFTPGGAPDDSEDDGLLTSEDLFGDLVDAAPDPRPAEATPPRKAPVRVQVPEPGAGRRPERAVMPRDVRPEEMAALLDAFEGPSQAALADVPPATPFVPQAPPDDAAEGLLADLAAPEATPAVGQPEIAGVDDLLDQLGVPGAELAAEPGGAPAEEERPPFADLELEPLELEAPDLAAELEPPALEPEPPDLELDVPLSFEAAEPEAAGLDEDILAGMLEPADEEEPPAPPAPTQPALEIPGLRELLAAARTPERPASRTGTKFLAAAPRREAAPEGGLDLGALAEDAFRSTERQEAPRKSGPLGGVEDASYGPYKLLERIAVGGMAEVFRAKRSGVEGFEKIVAVKRILPHLSDNKEFVDMFVDEAKMVAGLTHPNIVQIFDLGKIEKSYYIAMECVQGKDLRTILRRGREKGLRLPLDLSVLVVSRVCAALEYAHRARDDQGRAMRIVHRDISPQNILISFEGDVKLTDFGIAKAATKATSTDVGALRGKLLYMSPEQAWGKPMDRRSDLFSLGIVFYEMVTDQKPFLGTSEMSILETVRECRISPPSSFNPRLPEKIEKLILKALERDPDDRYQDAAEMARDLERVLRERQPPTSVELARYMEILFDRGDAAREGAEDAQQHAPERGLEIELDTGPEIRGSRETAPAAAGEESIQKLLKRFGIK